MEWYGTTSKVQYKGTVCVRDCFCVRMHVMSRRQGLFCPSGPPATAAPAPSPTLRGSAVTFALVALAGVCTYINVICINVIGALFPLQGLQPDTGVIIWKRGREEEPSIELIILTRALGEEKAARGREETGSDIRGKKGKMEGWKHDHAGVDEEMRDDGLLSCGWGCMTNTAVSLKLWQRGIRRRLKMDPCMRDVWYEIQNTGAV